MPLKLARYRRIFVFDLARQGRVCEFVLPGPESTFFVTMEMAVLRIAQINMIEK